MDPWEIFCSMAELMTEADMACSFLLRPGYLALAGILEEEFDSVVAAYSGLGFELLEAETLKEWRSGLFRKK